MMQFTTRSLVVTLQTQRFTFYDNFKTVNVSVKGKILTFRVKIIEIIHVHSNRFRLNYRLKTTI